MPIPNTSEGLLVFIGSGATPACAVVGNLVSDPRHGFRFRHAAPRRWAACRWWNCAGTSNCQVLVTNQLGNLPAAVTIDAGNPLVVGGSAAQAASGSACGLRCRMPRWWARATGSLNEGIAQADANGEYFVTLPGVPRPLHARRHPGDAAAERRGRHGAVVERKSGSRCA